MKARRGARGSRALAALTVAAIAVAAGLALTDDSGRPRARPPTTTAVVREIPPPTIAVPPNPPEHKVTRLDRLVERAQPLYCGSTRKPLVALTFDDGPGMYTAKILDELRRHNARATFFLVGNRIAAWPRMPARAATVGALGDHTWSHAYLPRLKPRRVAAELDESRAAIERAAGTEVRLFRPPYEAHTPAIDRGVRDRGMLEVLWSVDAADYEHGSSAARIARGVLDEVRPGSIVLLHDIQPRTPAVVRLVLRGLRHRGLRAVAIPELIRLNPPTPAQLAAGSLGCIR